MSTNRMCLKVKVKEFNKVKELLAKLCVVDLSFNITIIGGHVLIPLIDSHDILEKINGQVKIVPCNPDRRNLKGLRLKDIVKDYLSEDTINLTPSSYDIIGDIIVLPPLSEDFIKSYGCFIAHALKILHPKIRAVYVRSETIGKYRIRTLKLVWGDKVEYTIYKEHGIKFYVIPDKVYINPSLSTEHLRLTELVNDGSKVLDMFAGIGGFTLNIAMRKNVDIIAVDINPWAIKCLLKSIQLNSKYMKSRVLVFNTDSHLLPLILRHKVFDHIIMNLPHGSLEFLNDAVKLVKYRGILHVYVISKSKENAYKKLEEEITRIGHECSSYSIVKVLEYAPYKYIYRITCEVV